MIEEIAKPPLYMGGVVTTHISYNDIRTNTIVAKVEVPLYNVAVNSVGFRFTVTE